MEPGSRRRVFLVCVTLCFLQVWSCAEVVRRAALAKSVFLRPRRANSFFIEELLQGNLERECYEEMCSYEEAREYFEDTPKTNSFWTRYYDGDQCKPNPCLHGGNCTDRVGGFLCSCRDSYYGPTCEQGRKERPAGPTNAPIKRAAVRCSVGGPSSCHQFCRVWNIEVICSCADGFQLHTDQRTCLPEAEYPCGRWLPGNESQSALAPRPCFDGPCPWQVSVLDGEGEELCQGVVIGGVAVLTSAGCSTGTAADLHVGLGGPSGPQVAVRGAYVHRGFREGCHDNDLAVLHLATPLVFGPSLLPICLPTKDFSENVLMRAGSPGLARLGRGSEVVTYTTLSDCRRLNASHPISNKMFCLERQNKGRGLWASGPRWRSAPVASQHRGTAFLTGLLLSRPPGGRGLVFTKLSRFLPWISATLERIQRIHEESPPEPRPTRDVTALPVTSQPYPVTSHPTRDVPAPRRTSRAAASRLISANPVLTERSHP